MAHKAPALFHGIQFAARALVVNEANDRSHRIFTDNAIHLEVHMYIEADAIRARAALIAVTMAGTLFAGSLSARDLNRIESINVSARGLDLTRDADARTFYTQLQNAAWVVCTRGVHVGLVPIDNPKPCVDKALGDAIRSANVPLLTRIYLGSHTIEEAAAHGITLPSQVAAK